MDYFFTCTLRDGYIIPILLIRKEIERNRGYVTHPRSLAGFLF